jgi:WhiB family redox-sensing transcriptional regulator
MSGDRPSACPRCGIVRQVRTGANRTGYCQDCTTQRGQGTVSRSWMDDAACANVDPELFFPEGEDAWFPTRQAKQVCGSCPVRGMCAADTPVWDRFSIRGGMTATERRRKKVA